MTAASNPEMIVGHAVEGLHGPFKTDQVLLNSLREEVEPLWDSVPSLEVQGQCPKFVGKQRFEQGDGSYEFRTAKEH